MKIKAVISYDGSAYNGFQKQKNGLGIQDVLEKALEKIHKEKTPVTASGRTDAGVHALGQVIHFEGRSNMNMRGYYEAMNTLLPRDIRVLSVERAEDDFHARFSAKKKVYRYIYTFERDNPFTWRYKTVLKRKPDIEKMKQAAAFLIGHHDFTSFTHSKIDPNKPRDKTIESIDIEEKDKDLILTFKADGFLRYQVRMMTGAILAAGMNVIEPEHIKEMLEAKNKEACRFNAPACGLYLVKVEYDS